MSNTGVEPQKPDESRAAGCHTRGALPAFEEERNAVTCCNMVKGLRFLLSRGKSGSASGCSSVGVFVLLLLSCGDGSRAPVRPVQHDGGHGLARASDDSGRGVRTGCPAS
jgi:hypothetical protein